jgi:signal transduction histidine kinase
VLPLVVVAISTLLALLFAGQVWLDYQYARVPVSWPRALAISAIDWYLWAALTPAIWWLSRRAPIRRGAIARGIVVHLTASLLITAVKLPLQEALGALLAGVTRQPASFLKVYVTLLTYWAILAAGVGLRLQRERRARELRAADLQTELARARLDGLQMRLHPHFLFNTLNGISGLMRENVEAADLMLTRLSDLLRLTLARADVQEVALVEELDLLQRYLDIQQIRFGDRLQIVVDVPADTLRMTVPSMSLQPLVENALRHGVEQRPGAARVELRARVVEDTLCVDVIDDGPGPPASIVPGTGLQTTMTRLAHLYGARAQLTVTAQPGGGAIARLSLPARPLP